MKRPWSLGLRAGSVGAGLRGLVAEVFRKAGGGLAGFAGFAKRSAGSVGAGLRGLPVLLNGRREVFGLTSAGVLVGVGRSYGCGLNAF